MSIFLGDELGAIVDALVDEHEYTSAEKVAMDLGVAVLPNFLKDNTDRNRTSPFAFTGNKFEFRMPGSAVNLSDCNMILNTAMAKSLKDFADAMEGLAGEEFEAAAIAYIKETLKKHQRIIFNGNGYSDEWPVEAERRGLANHRTTADALPCFVAPKSIALFEEFGVLAEPEVTQPLRGQAGEVQQAAEHRGAHHEAHGAPRLPACPERLCGRGRRHRHRHQGGLPGRRRVVRRKSCCRSCLAGIKEIDVRLKELDGAHHAALEIADQQERANEYAHRIIPIMEALRAAVDAMEIVTDRDHWPVPTYNDILFYV